MRIYLHLYVCVCNRVSPSKTPVRPHYPLAESKWNVGKALAGDPQKHIYRKGERSLKKREEEGTWGVFVFIISKSFLVYFTFEVCVAVSRACPVSLILTLKNFVLYIVMLTVRLIFGIIMFPFITVSNFPIQLEFFTNDK